MRMRIIALVLALLTMLTLSACSGDAPSNTPPNSTPTDNSESNSTTPPPTTTPTADMPETPVSDFDYIYDAELGGVVITMYKGSNALTVRVPDTIEGQPVVSLGTQNGWHDGRPASPFNKASVMEVYLPDSIVRIGDHTFTESAITNIVIPDSVITIGSDAFEECKGLKTVTIGSGVTSIEGSAFFRCTGLASITVDANNPNFSDIDGVLFNKEKTELLMYPQAKSNTYIVPDGVTSIGSKAFRECDELTSVTIPDSVRAIGGFAFNDCRELTSVTIPDTVTSIGSGAFDGTALYRSAPDGLFYMDNWLVGYKGFDRTESVFEIKEGTKGISEGVFYNWAGLTSVVIPDSIMFIGETTFSSCYSLDETTRQRILAINPNAECGVLPT